MAKKETRKRRLIKEIVVPRNCPFCKTKINPNHRDIDVLARYVSDRAKILAKDRSGICAKHQRRLTVAIKRARHLALLPYVPQI